MASALNEMDNLKDLDVADFSMESLHLPPVSTSQENLNDDPPHNHDFFNKNSELAVPMNSRKSEQSDQFLNTSKFHLGSEEPRVSSAIIDSFSDNLFHSDEGVHLLSSKTVSDSKGVANLLGVHDTSSECTEYFCLNRLPGENLGMVLGIEGDQDNRHTIEKVVVKSVTPGGAVSRACDSNNKLVVGDEISEIDGQRLNKFTHDECIAVLQEMPDNVVLTIIRKDKSSGNKSELSYMPSTSQLTVTSKIGAPVPRPRKRSSHSDAQHINPEQLSEEVPVFNDRILQQDGPDCQKLARFDGDYDYTVPRGFRKLELTLFRDEEDSLGLSIVPSFGATCDLYQIKRYLPSGPCARPGLLVAGDRLLACNDQSLKGLTQVQCLNVLKSSGNFVNLTILRCTGDTDQVPLLQDASAELSSSADVETKETIFHSDITSNTDTSNSVTGQGKHLLEPLQDTFSLIDFDINESRPQEKLAYRQDKPENQDHLVNLDDIQLVDTGGSEADKKKDNNSWESIVQTDVIRGSSFHIPPPSDFSDAKSVENTESSESKEYIPLSVTNIDDLLFGTNESSGSVSCNSTIAPSEITHFSQADPLLISFDQLLEGDTSLISFGDSHTRVVDSTFTGQSTEKIEKDCLKNTEININNSKSGAETHNFHGQSSEYSSVTFGDYFFDTQSQEQQGLSRNSTIPVTVTPVSAISSSEECISKKPISSITESTDHHFSGNVLTPSKHSVHSSTRNILVHSDPPVNILNIDDLSNKNIVQEDTSPPSVKIIEHASSNVVLQTQGGSLTNSSKSATITIGGPPTMEASTNQQIFTPVVHTTVGVTNLNHSREQEEVVTPMVVVKDSTGTPLCYPSLVPVTGHSNELKEMDRDSKREIVNVLSSLASVSSNNITSESVKNGNEEEVSEKEIVPTLLTSDQKEIVLDVLKQWTAVDNSNKANNFKNTISDIIDGQRHAVLENAIVHTTLGVSNDGKTENPIQPMAVARDHQGKPLCIPSPTLERSVQDERTLDDHAKLEIANAMFSFIAPKLSQTKQDVGESRDLIAEDEIVPIVCTNDQRQTAVHILSSWVNADKPKEASINNCAVDELNMSQKHKISTATSSYIAESVKTRLLNKMANNNNLNLNTVEESVLMQSAPTTENNPSSTPNKINFSEESAKDFVKAVDSEQVHLRSKILNNTEKTSEQFLVESLPNQNSDHVILRNKSKQPVDFKSKIDNFQMPIDQSSSSVSMMSRRPRSMIDTSPFTTSSDMHKSFTNESKPVQAFRPLSAIRPLSSSTASVHHLSSASPGRPASANFSSSTFTTRTNKSDYPKIRQENGSLFQVDVLKGIVGLGLKVKVTPEGHTQVIEIQHGGPIDKNGQVSVGDYLLSINSTELSGQTDARVQQILRLLPRGLTKLVVSSAIPSSLTESQHSLDNNSQSSLLSRQPPLPDKRQSTPSLGSATSLNTANVGRLSFSQNKAVHVSDLSIPVTDIKEASTSISQAQEKVAEPTTSQEQLDSVTFLEKLITTTKSEQDILRLKAMPCHGVAYSDTESIKVSNEIITAREIQDLASTSVDTDDVSTIKIIPSEEVSLSSKNLTLDLNRGTVEHREEVRHIDVVPLKLRSQSVPIEKTNAVSNEDQIASPVSSLISPVTELLDKNNITLLEEQDVSPPLEQLKSVGSPPRKIPPPVAPKPRLTSTFFTKSEDSLDGADPNKSQPRPATGYETLQFVTNVPRPSSLSDKNSSFVSSTAKIFDNKAVSSHSASDHALISKRVSKGVDTHIDNSRTMNKSLFPLQDRQKHSHVPTTISVSQPVTVSSSSLLRSRPHSYREVISKEVASPESSSKNKESADDKGTTLTSPTRLNSALSPRRTSSFDSPSSPPSNSPTKHTLIFKDESQSKVLHSKPQPVQHYGIYQSTPLTLVTSKLSSHASHHVMTSPHNGQSLQAVTIEHHSKSITSSDQHPSYSTKEEKFQDTLKKFDDLQMNTSDTHTPQNMLLPSPVRHERSQLSQIVDPNTSQTTSIRKPVALPRKRPEHKESDIKLDVSLKDEVVLVKGMTEQTDLKVEEKQEELHVKEPKLVSDATEARTLSVQIDNELNSIVSSNFPLQTQKSCEISPENNLANTFSETCETIQNDEQENGHSHEISKVSNKVLETECTNTTDVSTNHEQQNKIINEDVLEHIDYQEEPVDVANYQTYTSLIGEDISKSFNQENTSIEKQEENEDNEIEMEILNNQASEIVEAVMARILNNPNELFKDQNAHITDELVSQLSYEDESLGSAPPPLPGAPPPPLILRDINLLVTAQDLDDQKDLAVTQEHILKNLFEKRESILKQPTSASKLEENTFTDSFRLNPVGVVDEDQTSKAESVQPLNSSGYSFLYNDGTRLDSQNPLDMLSEDSGMPADEDHEIISVDVISPPNECIKIISHSEEVPPFFDAEVNLLSTLTEPEKNNSLFSSEHSSISSVNKGSFIRGTDVDGKGVPENDSEENLPLPMLPTSACPSSTARNSTSNYTDEFLSQTSSPLVHSSVATSSMSREVNLFGDDISNYGSNDLVQEVPSSEIDSALRLELPETSVQYHVADNASVDLVSQPGTNIIDQGLLQERPLVTITSRRKWSLISNKSRFHVLSGDSQVPVHVDFAEETLSSSFPSGDLKFIIDKANTVLDVASAADTMSLLVVHIHQDEDSTALGFHLKHEGGIWFQVSGFSKGNSLWKDCGPKSGDWLISVDGLWCDQVTLVDFQSTLAKLKHDGLLVFVRGEKPVDAAETKSAKPIPSPRPRSAHKTEADEHMLKMNIETDVASPSVELSPVQASTVCSTQDELATNESQHNLSTSEKKDKLQQYLTEETSLAFSKQSTRSPSEPDTAQPLPIHEPPLPVQMSTCSDDVAQKKGLQFQKEKPPALVMKSHPQSTSEGYATLIKLNPVSNGDLENAGSVHRITAKSEEPVKSLPAISTAQIEQLTPKTSQTSPNTSDKLGPGIHKVVMIKGASGVGFCLEGGISSPKGNLPVTIKRIFKGGPAEKCGNLMANDEILEVNGVKFDCMRHSEAWNHLKFLDDGEVHITIRRY